MSIIKSSVLNLYDAINGDHHFQSKISSELMEMHVSTLPLTIKGAKINFANEGGEQITDVVKAILDLGTGASQSTATFNVALATEKTNREDAAAALKITLEDQIGVNTSENSDEIAKRTSEIKRLEDLIEAEKAARKVADSAEIASRGAQFSVVETKIVDAVLTIGQEAATLKAHADAEVQRVDEKTVTEFTSVKESIGNLQLSLTQEQELREQEDSQNRQSIVFEKEAREEAMSAEQIARGFVDESIVVSLNTEILERKEDIAKERKRIDAIVDGANVDLDTLTELVANYSSADSEITDQVIALTDTLTLIKEKLDKTDAIVQTLIDTSVV